MLVIGADQVAVLEREILSKPCYHERAVVQFIRASGKAVIFYTGLYLIDSGSCRCQVDVVPFWVVFRSLTHLQIEHYGGRKPYFCRHWSLYVQDAPADRALWGAETALPVRW
jgi:septum formation protein